VTLQRRTPLRRDTPKARAFADKRAPLARTQMKASRKPLPARSARKAQTDAVLDAAKQLVRIRSGGACEAMTPACPAERHDAHHVHHTRRRRGAKDDHDPAFLLHTCAAGHEHIHRFPAEAYEHGWLTRSTSD